MLLATFPFLPTWSVSVGLVLLRSFSQVFFLNLVQNILICVADVHYVKLLGGKKKVMEGRINLASALTETP